MRLTGEKIIKEGRAKAKDISMGRDFFILNFEFDISIFIVHKCRFHASISGGRFEDFSICFIARSRHGKNETKVLFKSFSIVNNLELKSFRQFTSSN